MSQPVSVDPRALRFSAALTSVVLAAVLLVPSPAREILLAVQLVIFGIGAFINLQATPYAWAFRTFVRPRIGAPKTTEAAAPPVFAQIVGFAFAGIGLIGLLTSNTVVGLVAVAFAFVAALLNATTGFCLGCELYLLTRRVIRANN